MMKQTFTFAGLLNRTPINRYFVMASLAAVLLFVVGGCKEKEDSTAEVLPRPVKVITVAGTADTGVVSFPGKTRANQRADLSFKVAGPLVEFPVEEGQAVQQGQLIARIDPRDFETRVKEIKSSLAEAKANLKSMEKGARVEDIKMLEAEVEAATAEYLYAEDQYNRYKQLWIKQHASRADFDRQSRLRKTAKASLEAAKQDLAKGKRGARKEDIEAQKSRIRGLEAKLKAAGDALGDTYLKAPFAGVVGKRYVENHQEVQAKQPIVFLQDISRIEVLVDVPENLANWVREKFGPDVVARFVGMPDQFFPLTLKEFSTEADPQTLTYQAVLVMDRPEGIHILPGMTATVEGSPGFSEENRSSIMIPAIAVTRDSEKTPFVWILDEADMIVKKTTVRIGALTGSENIVILDGLKLGEKVVTAGVSKIRAGMKVSIWGTSK